MASNFPFRLVERTTSEKKTSPLDRRRKQTYNMPALLERSSFLVIGFGEVPFQDSRALMYSVSFMGETFEAMSNLEYPPCFFFFDQGRFSCSSCVRLLLNVMPLQAGACLAVSCILRTHLGQGPRTLLGYQGLAKKSESSIL